MYTDVRVYTYTDTHTQFSPISLSLVLSLPHLETEPTSTYTEGLRIITSMVELGTYLNVI